MTTTVTCPGCGAFVPLGDRFCGACGTPISGSALMSGESARFDPWEELLQKLRQATIGEYEIKGELGRGGMAAVLLAHDLQLNRKVAIKVMLPGLVYGASMWERFLSEARTAAKLDHPNIIYIHSVKEKDRFLYFVMKYIDGATLDDILAQGTPLPVPVAQTILVEVARALDYAHNEGVVHRDIKPANIMIDQKGNAIVMDFGIARATDEKRFTQTGATIGTPAYMSPEQCRGNETTAASDQYSLGILAYEMLTGAPPFVGTPIELQIAHMQDAPKGLRDARPELSLELSGAIMRMLAKEPAERWPSLQQLVPIFARGLDPDDQGPRNHLVSLVREGSPRRKSFPATPVSPTPISSAALPSSPTTAVSAAELAAHAQRMSVEAAALASGPQVSAGTPSVDARVDTSGGIATVGAVATTSVGDATDATVVTGDGIATGAAVATGGAIADEAVGGDPAPRRPKAGLVAAGIVVAAVALWAIFGRGDSGRDRPVAKAADSVSKADSARAASKATDSTTIAASAANAAANTAQAASNDSVAVGHGPDATRAVDGKTPRAVKPDAVSLAVLSLARPRVRVGDTVVVRLALTDDFTLPVTTHEVTWTTSNPRALKFLGPGQMVALSEGRVTISATVGSATNSLPVIIEPRRTAVPQKRTGQKAP